ncbi:MAG: ATP-dependent RNA helicase HrpA, partial [Phycisphaerales bacterium]
MSCCRWRRLKLGRPEEFPFVEAPDHRLIRDGYETLRELGAIDDAGELTPIGKEMARLPIDPRIARMVLAAREEDCLREVLVIATALATQDPRDRPLDKRDAADEAHAKFRDERSDFLDYLNIWAFYHEQSKKLSRSKLQKACAQNFLSARRLNEWREVYRQVRGLLVEMGATPRHAGQGEPADYDRVHRALLSGLLTSVGKKGDGFEYEGVRGSHFHIFPGSGQFEARPKWIMAAEIVRTTRVYARTVARIEPEWIEAVGGRLVKRTHAEPRWDERTARVMADEKVSLFGLEIIPRRAVHFGPIDPASSRELFIHHALVEDEYQTRSQTIKENRRLVRRIASLEDKARRRDILADAQTRFVFYDRRLPPDVYSGQTLERWLKRAAERDPDVLRMRESDLLVGDAASVSADAYPTRLGIDGDELRLRYMYNPGEARDGVTLEIPVEKLGQVRREETDWVVPGLRAEKIEALMRTLPKSLRRHFDIRPVAMELAGSLTPGARTMIEEVADALAARAGVRVSPEDFRPGELPEHLSMNYRVTDAAGKTLGEGRDLASLRRELAGEVKAGFDAAAAEAFNRDGLTDWDFDELPEFVETRHGGRTLRGYPALADLNGKAGLRLFDSPEGAAASMRGGLARLYVHHLKAEMRYRAGHLPGIDSLRLWYAPVGDAAALERDLLLLVADR